MASTETPLMRQYGEVKSRHGDALLFFRMGDFYEMFFDDAIKAAKALDIALTSRNKNDPNPVPMCGVPHHAATNYVNRLVNAGFKVAICEQLEDPATTKGIVKRDVVRVVSPGTRLDPDALDAKAPNYTHAAVVRDDGSVTWATCDFTTGRFWIGRSADERDWLAYAASQAFAEALFPETDGGRRLLELMRAELPRVYAQTVPSFYFDAEYAAARAQEQFGVAKLSAVHPRLADEPAPAGALVKYFQETQKAPRIPSATRVDVWGQDESMELDAATLRALEILPTSAAARGAQDISLLSWLDRTKTAMGGRLLRDWILRPLTSLSAIEARLGQVEALSPGFEALHPYLNEIYDLERLLSRVSLGHGASASARELYALAQSILKAQELESALAAVPDLKRVLSLTLSKELLALASETLAALVDQPPALTREGGMFRKGFRADLDELIALSENGEQWLADLEAREKKATGIASLKVRFNRVFGYYIEITKANLASVPTHYIRKQTMVGGERYITEELKSFEEKILTAEKRRTDLEYSLFREFCARFAEQSAPLVALARAVAQVDAIASLAAVAFEEDYVRPRLDDSLELAIDEGRHPTIARLVDYVPNSVTLTPEKRFMLITGPNMGGKSTVMRQTALIALMAQMGSFVPARAARIGLVDRVFTRIGANDNSAEGSSTFMVEMSEMSFILRHATAKSLILIDEIGRGTSTYDGMSLAWAIASDIATRVSARTMFATHYHELTRLAQECDSVSNARVAVAVSEKTHDIRFLYKLEAGVAERSYGILVARLAGLPDDVLKMAGETLAQLEDGAQRAGATPKNLNQLALNFGAPARKPKAAAASSATVADETESGASAPKLPPEPPKPSPVETWLKSLEVNKLTPLDALVQLAQWKEKIGTDAAENRPSDR